MYQENVCSEIHRDLFLPHQVLKYSPKHELLLTLGEAFIPGHDEAHFCKPTSVAVASNGDFFVADG